MLQFKLSDAEAYELCSHNRIVSIAADSMTCAGIELPEKWLSAFKRQAWVLAEQRYSQRVGTASFIEILDADRNRSSKRVSEDV